ATEAALVELWTELLGLNSLSVTDNFFELGGHSLLAAQLVSRIRDSFQVELPLRRLFEIPVLEEMAAEIQSALVANKPDEAMLSAPPPIVPVSREQEFPLSFAQERLWFLHQLEPGTSAYNILFALRLTGALDQSALERAFVELIHRHEVLRTGYLISDGQPIQYIQDNNLPFHIWNQDLSTELMALDEPARKRRIGQILVTEAQKPFDLTHPPMLRVGVLKLAENDHILVLTLHHIAADGWSMGILVRELGMLYRAYSKGLSPLLPPLPVQYADFAHWQRGWLQGTVLEAQVAYWKEKLQDVPPVLELPTDRPRPAMQTFNGATRGFALSAEVTQSLHALSRREGVTLFMTLLAAYNVFLARYSGQADICVGTTTANRNRKEIEGLIGYFLNTLVLRTRLESGSSTQWTTFRELLGRVRETTLGAFSHQDVPFEKLVEVLHPKRELSHSPLFQVAFVLQNTPLQTVPLGDIQVQLLSGTDNTAKYDLLLSVIETADGLKCGMEYNTDLFDASTIDRMISHFRTLVENLLASPDESVSLVPMMSPAEAHQILVEWNTTAVELTEPLLAHRRFEQQVAQTPEATAVEFINPQTGERTSLSYFELNQQAERLATHLQTLGVGPDVIVGLCLERSVEMVVGILGILKAGGAFLPMDPTYPADRLAFMAEDARLSVMVTDTQSTQWLSENEKVTTINLKDINSESEVRNPEPRTLNPEPQNLAYVIYTSGSTGKPKGTLLTHQGLCNLSVAQQRAFQVTPGDRVLQFASLSFDAAVWEVAMALLSGSTLVVTTRETVTSPEHLVRFLQTESITIATLPPTMLSAMPATNLPALRLLVVAGERCPAEVANQWSPGRRFVNAYGPTETTVCASMFECHGTLTQPPPIGRPIANTQLFIVDPWGNPVPAGIPGELYIGGTSLARGYLNQPKLGSERFAQAICARLCIRRSTGKRRVIEYFLSPLP
ncbi:MAG TPA: amino acid adenylation domain-containing protein, partial [Acidobacteriota bacterium]|nr:amino acid adenylation domain-containing protein [Acidobacteriota bacterium]